MRQPQIQFYVDEPLESDLLGPMAVEFRRRGFSTASTNDFETESEVGIFACHPNRFFDFNSGNWNRPPADFSIICAHDFNQATEAGPAYFIQDGWHLFDIGLVPGPAMYAEGARALHLGYQLPRFGLHQVGWVPSDRAFTDGIINSGENTTFRRSIVGPDTRKIALLACSWSSPKHLLDTLNYLDVDKYVLVVRYPKFRASIPDSPWAPRLAQARVEVQQARGIAQTAQNVIVAADDTNLFDLLAISDVVISNGSTVLKEGLLLGVPGVSIRSWQHPSGPNGAESVTPVVAWPGVVEGPVESLSTMMNVTESDDFSELVSRGRAQLVPNESLGCAAHLAAEVIQPFLSRKRAGVRESLRRHRARSRAR